MEEELPTVDREPDQLGAGRTLAGHNRKRDRLREHQVLRAAALGQKPPLFPVHRTSVQSFALGDDSVHAARMDLIRVVGLELRCIVGVRSYERRREQPLRVDIALGLDLSTAGRSGLIGDSVDYSEVADGITALLRFREYRLLEVAAEEASALLFAAYP